VDWAAVGDRAWWSGGRITRAASSCVEGAAERTHEAGRKSSARSVTAENYSGVESFDETKAINGPPRREADWATTLHSACGASDKPLADMTLRRVVIKLEDNVFNDLPLLLAVPRAAQLLGISRAAAYRLAASGDLPVRRLGGRVYVVTAGLRELAS
jgi:helix-turn-helix protein